MNLGFVLENTLGNATYGENLKRFIGDGGMVGMQPHYFDLSYEDLNLGAWSKLPMVQSNWTVRASLRAYLALKPVVRNLDAVLFHTQTTALFSTGLMRRVPSVISMDATPVQLEEFGDFYGLPPRSNNHVERFKHRMYVKAFHAARHLVTMSEWAKQSLVNDYGIASAKVTVIPPGVDIGRWMPKLVVKEGNEPINLLFVGGDFKRKGGDTLLEALGILPAAIRARICLHVVTRDAVPPLPGIVLHQNMKGNSQELIDLYQDSDMFVLPTRADCFSLVTLEAMACGLPVITTNVGGIADIVKDGHNGFVVIPDSAALLARAIEKLVLGPDLRKKMGLAAREDVEQRFDARKNFARIVQTVRDQALSA